MNTLNLTPEEEARMIEVFERGHAERALVDRGVDASRLDGAPARALRWLLAGFILDPDDGETARRRRSVHRGPARCEVGTLR